MTTTCLILNSCIYHCVQPDITIHRVRRRANILDLPLPVESGLVWIKVWAVDCQGQGNGSSKRAFSAVSRGGINRQTVLMK